MADDNVSMKKLEIAVQTRQFEIGLFWTRSLFFWGFIAAAFTGFAALAKKNPEYATAVACFGLVCSVAWTLVNRGSKYWQESWEAKVEREEKHYLKAKLFRRVEKVQYQKGFWLRARQYSVSKLAIALSDFTVLVWFAVIYRHLCKPNEVFGMEFSTFCVLFSGLYIVLMLIACQSSLRDSCRDCETDCPDAPNSDEKTQQT